MVILPKAVLDENSGYLPYGEALAKYKAEKIEPILDSYKLWDHDSFRDFHRRKGQVLHSSEFILRINRLNPGIFVQQQLNFPDEWGFYLDVAYRAVYLSGFPKGWLTEFSYCLVDERDLPSEEKRGWRTVLVRLMGRGALTWEQVESEFGDSEGFNSERWLPTPRLTGITMGPGRLRSICITNSIKEMKMPEQELLTPKEKALVAALIEGSNKNAITPEIMVEIVKQAGKPYEDPAMLARENRERIKSRRDFHEGVRVTAAQQKACPHKHKDGQNALNLQHNFPDGKPRGICPLCFLFIQPQHWEFLAPDPKTGAERPVTILEHPLYHMVMEKEVMT